MQKGLWSRKTELDKERGRRMRRRNKSRDAMMVEEKEEEDSKNQEEVLRGRGNMKRRKW